MDTLRIRAIRAYGYTGFFDAEQELGQWFAVDLAIRLDLSRTGADDDLAHALNYAEVVAAVGLEAPSYTSMRVSNGAPLHVPTVTTPLQAGT